MLVDSTINVEYSVNDNGEILAEHYKCYSVWNMAAGVKTAYRQRLL